MATSTISRMDAEITMARASKGLWDVYCICHYEVAQGVPVLCLEASSHLRTALEALHAAELAQINHLMTASPASRD